MICPRVVSVNLDDNVEDAAWISEVLVCDTVTCVSMCPLWLLIWFYLDVLVLPCYQ